MVPGIGTGSQRLWDLDQVLERGWTQQGLKEKPARSAAQAESEAPLRFPLGPRHTPGGSAWNVLRAGPCPPCTRSTAQGPLLVLL